jgi:hypothetical protein
MGVMGSSLMAEAVAARLTLAARRERVNVVSAFIK